MRVGELSSPPECYYLSFDSFQQHGEYTGEISSLNTIYDGITAELSGVGHLNQAFTDGHRLPYHIGDLSEFYNIECAPVQHSGNEGEFLSPQSFSTFGIHASSHGSVTVDGTTHIVNIPAACK